MKKKKPSQYDIETVFIFNQKLNKIELSYNTSLNICFFFGTHIFSYLCTVFQSGCHKDLKFNKKAHFLRVPSILFLCLILLLQTFPKTLIMMDYFLNTEAYAAFCVNKEKPELGCNGSCQMEKAMKNMDHEQEHPVTPLETIVVVYTIPEIFQSEFKNTTVAKEISYPKYRECATNSVLNKLLRPPQSFS